RAVVVVTANAARAFPAGGNAAEALTSAPAQFLFNHIEREECGNRDCLNPAGSALCRARRNAATASFPQALAKASADSSAAAPLPLPTSGLSASATATVGTFPLRTA